MPREAITLNMLEHTCWGNSLNWWNFDKRAIYGWFDERAGDAAPFNRPAAGKLQVGDRLVTELVSGNRAEFEIVSLDYKDDPTDMFFGVVKDVRYIPLEGSTMIRCAHDGERDHPASASVWNDGQLAAATCAKHADAALNFAGPGARLEPFMANA